MGKAADLIVGGWNTSFTISTHSGFPVTIIGTQHGTRLYAETCGPTGTGR
jgi:hypothetical protein